MDTLIKLLILAGAILISLMIIICIARYILETGLLFWLDKRNEITWIDAKSNQNIQNRKETQDATETKKERIDLDEDEGWINPKIR